MAHSPISRILPDADTAVVFVHGILGTPDHFLPFLPLIPESWSCCNLLLDGHGGSVQNFSHTSMALWQQQVADTLALLRAHHCRIYMVGHSMGTLLCLQAALKHPEAISGLFLLAVPLRVHLKPVGVKNSLAVIFNRIDPTDPVSFATQKACSIQTTRKLWQYLPWLQRYGELFRLIAQIRTQLPELRIPATAFQSQHDELVRPSACRDLQKTGIPCTLLPHSGHYHYAPDDLALLQHAFQAFCRDGQTF